VSSSANLSWPASLAGWACFATELTIDGHTQDPLAGNVVGPIQHLLQISFARRG
jgi:hypothetical protein